MTLTQANAGGETPAFTKLRSHLIETIERWTETDSDRQTRVPGLVLYKRTQPVAEMCTFHTPALALIVQGSKTVQLGEDTYVYDESHFLLTAVDLPIVSRVVSATPKRPYLSAVLQFNLQAARDVIADCDLSGMHGTNATRAIGTGPATSEVFDAFTRLIALLDRSEDIPILAPLIERELLYRLLRNEAGQRLRAVVSSGTQSSRMAEAIAWLKNNYRQPLHVAALARKFNMGESTLHHHFRAVTTISPLQYQKQLRLHQARRLLISGLPDIAAVAEQVGYASSTQFSREYSRLFGLSPSQDLKLLQSS